MLLQLKRVHYDAIKSRRKRWEARPLVRDNNRPSLCAQLATVGRTVVLQSGAGTNDRVCIAEVRRYASVHDMVAELGADLLPDQTDRVQVYRDLYGDLGCGRGFVAMRLEWPNGAAAASISDDSHLAGSSAEPTTCKEARNSKVHQDALNRRRDALAMLHQDAFNRRRDALAMLHQDAFNRLGGGSLTSRAQYYGCLTGTTPSP